MKQYEYVVLGGGAVAGYAAREFAEQQVEHNQLALISEDSVPPYERPPLSEGSLESAKDREDSLVNDESFYRENGIDVFLKTRIKEVNFDLKDLISDEDERFSYDKLLIATGSRLRKLDVRGEENDAVYYLHSLDDAQRIRRHAQVADSAVVIVPERHSTYMGMEAAAVLQEDDLDVAVVFPEEHVMDHLFTPEMAGFFEERYRDGGVTLMNHSGVTAFRAVEDKASSRRQKGNLLVELDSGETLATDMAVIAAGTAPVTGLFEDTGLQLAGGESMNSVTVNEFLETSIPDVYAAGDVASYYDPLYNKRRRVTYRDSTIQQARHAARSMLGQREPFMRIPYFFSDAFNLTWEFWGDPENADDVIYRGDLENGEFSVWWCKTDTRTDARGLRLVAAFVMNRPAEEREFAQYFIRSQEPVPKAALAEESASLERQLT